jgi:hypothetical protein
MTAVLSDEEVLATFMETKPNGGGRRGSHWWWYRSGLNSGAGWRPRSLDLDALHEVEARLTDEQWDKYQRGLSVYCGSELRAGDVRASIRQMIHALPVQKIRALAAVLRPEVEK